MIISTTHICITKENFEDIYKENYTFLLKYTFVIVKSKEQAQDIVADLFCSLWNNREKLTIHTNIRNYLLVSARRMANKQLVKSSHLSLSDMSSAPEGLTSQVSASAGDGEKDPQTAFIHKENALLFEQLLSQLSPQRQDIIQLRLLGLTYLEIAEAMHITAKKVEYHLSVSIFLLKQDIKSKPHLRELSFLLLLPQLLTEVTFW